MTRIPVKLTVAAKFLAGPWAGLKLETDSLDPLKVVLDDFARVVHAYINQQDGIYLYSPQVTAYLSRDYDAAAKKWGGTTFQVQTG